MMYIVFFLFSITCSLWFGEMKQGTIELVWIALTCIFFLVHFLVSFKKKQQFLVSNRMTLLFLAVLIPCIVSTLYSASPAYSISFLLRMLVAWCIFVLLYSLHKKETLLPLFATYAIYLGGGIAAASLFFRFFPNMASMLPTMNLIFSHSGHNQGVNLLITIFPIAFHYAERNNNKIMRAIAYILFPIAILLCFSRGAALITGIYLLIATLIRQKKRNNVVYILIAAFFGITALLFSTAALPITVRDQITKLPFGLSQITKSNLSEEARLANWEQAFKGFASSPLLGTGPNTYILTSMQHHKTPIDGAGLAHNWYIQTLSEVGLLGIIPILYLLFSVIRTLMKQRNEAVKQENNRSWAVIGLVDSVCIALAYSLIEYNLDYFTLWVLLWGTVGLLLPIQQKKKIHVAFAQGMTLLCLVIIAGFLGINLYANTRLNTIETAEKRFLFQPYDTNKTQRYIEYKNIIGQPLTSKERAIILLWHKKHPDVLMTLATAANSGTTEERKHFYDQAIARNPLNTYYYQSYFTFLYETKQTEAMQTLFFAFINQAYHVTHPSSEPEVFFRAGDAILPYLNPELFSLFSGAASFPEVASKVLYFIGLSSLPTAPKLTEELWTLAKDISPDWSSFHMELAAYYLHTANKLGMSRQILFDCQKREAPREACKREMDTFPNILYPGEQQMNVKMIPEFY